MANNTRRRKLDCGKTPLSNRFRQIFVNKNNQEIANIMGVTERSVRSYLSGISAPPPGSLENVVRHTNCSASWLLTGDGEPFPDQPCSNTSTATADRTHHSDHINRIPDDTQKQSEVIKGGTKSDSDGIQTTLIEGNKQTRAHTSDVYEVSEGDAMLPVQSVAQFIPTEGTINLPVPVQGFETDPDEQVNG